MQHVSFTEDQIRILALADLIERLPPSCFNMEYWLDRYNCPSCIGGWAVWQMLGDKSDAHKRIIMKSMDIAKEAALYLGLYGQKLRDLFTPDWNEIMDYPPMDATTGFRSQIPKEWAAATLRHLAATGEVNWKKAKRQMLRHRLPELVYERAELVP